jgi:hypothetical protein
MIVVTSGSPAEARGGRIPSDAQFTIASGKRSTEGLMLKLVKAPIRAGRHLAIWIVWHSTGVTLLPSQRP